METDSEPKRSQFGSRYLTDESKVFEHNAWDDVEWDSEIEQEACRKIQLNSKVTLSDTQIEQFEADADKYWNSFYSIHQNKFFKDRHWLFTEFEELAPKKSNNGSETEEKEKVLEEEELVSKKSNNDIETEEKEKVTQEESVPNESLKAENGEGTTKIFEVGCGVGNTVFPILQTNIDPGLFIYCCDFAESAIELVKSHALYDTNRCHAFVCDVAGEAPEFPIAPNSIDFIVFIFVLSAIHPDRMLITLKRLTSLLKPGGKLLFRDYGRHDMAQLRFKPGKCLSENFYVRGDGTRVYFFTQDELDDLLTQCGLVKVQNIIDRRLQVNRGRQIKMYRVWIQCKYQKPDTCVS